LVSCARPRVPARRPAERWPVWTYRPCHQYRVAPVRCQAARAEVAVRYCAAPIGIRWHAGRPIGCRGDAPARSFGWMGGAWRRSL